MNISIKIKRAYLFITYFYRFPRDYFFCKWKIGAWNPSWRFWGLPIIQKHSSATIKIGKDFTACSDPYKNSIGVFQKVIIKAQAPDSKIIIGNNVGISGATISGRCISIGNNVLVGSGVIITDNDAHPIHPLQRNDARYLKNLPVIIEDDVFIGARAIILKGVVIGRGSVIGAGSVVTKSIPEMCIASGNPAKVVKNIRDIGEYTLVIDKA